MTPTEKDRERAREVLGPCNGHSCRVRPTFDLETGEPDGGSYMYHMSECPADSHEELATALASARAEGRREALTQVLAVLEEPEDEAVNLSDIIRKLMEE